jgi:YVTN family beta-propeller protein
VTARRRTILFATPGAILLLAAMGTSHYYAAKHVHHYAGNDSASLDCLPCHVYPVQNGVLGRVFQEHYLSPRELTVARDGKRLYVTAEEGDALLVVDLDTRAVVDRIPVGSRPHSVVLSRDGATAYVSDRRSGTVSQVDLTARRVSRAFTVGDGPAGMALDADERFLYVANGNSNDISVVDLASGREVRRLAAGQNPHDVALAPDGRHIYVTNRLSNPVPFRTAPITEVTVIDTRVQHVSERRELRDAHMLQGLDFTPRGDLALVTLTRPKNLLPTSQVQGGWMVTFGLGVLAPGEHGGTWQVLLDDPNAAYADPYDVVVTPDGRRAFVSQSGANVVSVIDLDSLRAVLAVARPGGASRLGDDLGLSSRYVVARVPTGPNPMGLAVSPDGKSVYVAERLADRVAILSVDSLRMVGDIDLGGPRRTTFVRRGQRLFHSADHTFHGGYSCRTCHPDGSDDGLSYDIGADGLGRNIVNNLSLRELQGLSPYKWNGGNVSLYYQCGYRFAKFLTRTQAYSETQLDQVVAYILSLTYPHNRYRSASGALTPAQERGQQIFDRTVTNDGRAIPVTNRCVTCHPPPRFTDRQKFDVGTKGPTDAEGAFDTPALVNLYASAPYLHDGRAATLEEIWTRFGSEDRHGVVTDLTKSQLNDLVEYLESLSGAVDQR